MPHVYQTFGNTLTFRGAEGHKACYARSVISKTDLSQPQLGDFGGFKERMAIRHQIASDNLLGLLLEDRDDLFKRVGRASICFAMEAQ